MCGIGNWDKPRKIHIVMGKKQYKGMKGKKKEKERERLVRKTVKKICIVFLVLTQISFVTMAIPLVSLGLHLPTSKCR